MQMNAILLKGHLVMLRYVTQKGENYGFIFKKRLHFMQLITSYKACNYGNRFLSNVAKMCLWDK